MTQVATVRLRDVCRQDRVSVKTGERSSLKYIGLESIEANTGEFANGVLSKTPESPLANSFYFSPQHVLYGKLRPYLNKVALPDFEGKCSTEIIPLLPSATLDRSYLSFFLRTPRIVTEISGMTAGSRMPRADLDYLLGLELTLPPIPEQRRIVDILSRAESIVRLRREAQKKAAELIPALFLDTFGDPATNPKGWPVSVIEKLCAVRTGATPSRDNAVFYENGTVPWIKTGEVNGSRILRSEESISEAAITATNCKTFPVNTLLVAMYGQGQTRGRVGILGIQAATNQACAAILPSPKLNPSISTFCCKRSTNASVQWAGAATRPISI